MRVLLVLAALTLVGCASTPCACLYGKPAPVVYELRCEALKGGAQ